MQQINLFNQINIATRKVKGSIKVGQLRSNYKETLRSFICQDQAFLFMNSVKGTPAYWKNFLYDVLAMVKQLGLPTFFLTLSCADLRWNELVQIINRLNNMHLPNENDLDYFEKCSLLNQNPVLTARHFQYRVEAFFKEILLSPDSPIGQVQHYVIKVEFQFRGSPHIHAFLWVPAAPVLNSETKDSYLSFVDSVIRTDLPDPVNDVDLYSLVSKYQTHTHSRTCRKYKNVPCRFNYGRFFTEKTIIAEPLPDDISEIDRTAILSSRSDILKKVKAFIDDNLHPRKPTYKEYESVSAVLKEL